MDNYINELKTIPIPKQPNEENQYRILSFPWCIAGNVLSSQLSMYSLNRSESIFEP